MSVQNGDVMLHIHRLACIIYTQCVGALLDTYIPYGVIACTGPRNALNFTRRSFPREWVGWLGTRLGLGTVVPTT